MRLSSATCGARAPCEWACGARAHARLPRTTFASSCTHTRVCTCTPTCAPALPRVRAPRCSAPRPRALRRPCPLRPRRAPGRRGRAWCPTRCRGCRATGWGPLARPPPRPPTPAPQWPCAAGGRVGDARHAAHGWCHHKRGGQGGTRRDWALLPQQPCTAGRVHAAAPGRLRQCRRLPPLHQLHVPQERRVAQLALALGVLQAGPHVAQGIRRWAGPCVQQKVQPSQVPAAWWPTQPPPHTAAAPHLAQREVVHLHGLVGAGLGVGAGHGGRDELAPHVHGLPAHGAQPRGADLRAHTHARSAACWPRAVAACGHARAGAGSPVRSASTPSSTRAYWCAHLHVQRVLLRLHAARLHLLVRARLQLHHQRAVDEEVGARHLLQLGRGLVVLEARGELLAQRLQPPVDRLAGGGLQGAWGGRGRVRCVRQPFTSQPY